MIYVLYHSNCPDGFGAAYAAWRRFGESAEYIPVTHGQPYPSIIESPEADVYILDFSYKRADLEKLKKIVKSLTVLDHHKTAEEDLRGLDYCTFDINRSGALISYDHFTNKMDNWYIRAFFQYISDRDLWQWKYPNSREINACFMSYPYTFAAYDNLCSMFVANPNLLIQEGLAIMRQNAKDIDMICDQSELIQWCGHQTVVVNATSNWSDVGHRLLERHPEAKISLSYCKRKVGDWRFSLRSRGDIDVSTLAKAYGGGGHQQAAGFEWPDLTVIGIE